MAYWLWQYPARIEPVYVPPSESETLVAAWAQPVMVPRPRRECRWVSGWSEVYCPGQAWEVPWIDAASAAVPARTTPRLPQFDSADPVHSPSPITVEWVWHAGVEVPSRRRPRRPEIVLHEPVDAVLPPFEWYCGLEPPTPATRVAWRGATGSLTLLPSLWATEYEAGVGYFEISDHFSLGMFP